MVWQEADRITHISCYVFIKLALQSPRQGVCEDSFDSVLWNMIIFLSFVDRDLPLLERLHDLPRFR